ncbi:hypothetical protein [Halorubrum halophilum]|uniref:hypothetical protein n=1 Tax=Halorubrum halophilum TaxID=413816 RepID=UPI0012ABB2A9|nr:hypothetical protein [Halorubrum halophilum]
MSDEGDSLIEPEQIQQVAEKIESVGSHALRVRYVISRIQSIAQVTALFIGSLIILFAAPIILRIPAGDALWLLVIAILSAFQIIIAGAILKSIAAEAGVIEGEFIPEAESYFTSPVWVNFPVVIDQSGVELESPIGYRKVKEQLEILNLFPGDSLQTQTIHVIALWSILTLINWTVISAPYTIGYLDILFVGDVEIVELYAENGLNPDYSGFYLIAIPLLLGEISALAIRSTADVLGWTEEIQDRLTETVTETFWTKGCVESPYSSEVGR